MTRMLLSAVLIATFGVIPPAQSATEKIPYRQVAHQERGPCCDHLKWRAYATDRSELRTAWRGLNLEGDPPRVGFERRVAVVAGTAGSSSCPPNVGSLRLNREDERIVVRIRYGARGDGGCTADWVPNTFVLTIRRADVPPGDLSVRVYRVNR